MTVKILASTMIGDVAVSDGIVYLLTDCCKASGKGSERGVVCRSCYQLVSDDLGWGALASDGDGQVQLAAMLRNSLHQYADQAAADIFAAARAAGCYACAFRLRSHQHSCTEGEQS